MHCHSPRDMTSATRSPSSSVSRNPPDAEPLASLDASDTLNVTGGCRTSTTVAGWIDDHDERIALPLHVQLMAGSAFPSA